MRAERNVRGRQRPNNSYDFEIEDPKCYYDGAEYIELEKKVVEIMLDYPADGEKWIEPRQVHTLVGDTYTREWVEDAMRTTLCRKDPFSIRDRYQMSKQNDKKHIWSLPKKSKDVYPTFHFGGKR